MYRGLCDDKSLYAVFDFMFVVAVDSKHFNTHTHTRTHLCILCYLYGNRLGLLTTYAHVGRGGITTEKKTIILLRVFCVRDCNAAVLCVC